MHTTQASVDLAKSVFEVAVSATPGSVQERHRLNRARFRRFFENREPTEVLMEACGTAHFWGRELEAMGHSVSLLHPGVRRRRFCPVQRLGLRPFGHRESRCGAAQKTCPVTVQSPVPPSAEAI